MNRLFRLFLAFNSTSLILVLYLIKQDKTLNCLSPCLKDMPHFVSFITYLLISVLLTYVSLLLSRYLDFDSVESEKGESAIKEIELAVIPFLPSYLGYFFVALSVNHFETLIFVFAILFIFTYAISNALFQSNVFTIWLSLFLSDNS